MKNRQLFRKPALLILILFCLLLCSAVVFLMNYVQTLLNTDAQINLTEIVTQNKDTITSRLLLEMNTMQTISSKMSDRLQMHGKADEAALRALVAEFGEEDAAISVADAAGIAYFPDQTTIDIAGRKYHRLAMDNIQNISDRLVSRRDGSDIFSISVPLHLEDEIVGTVQKSYTPDEMYALCATPLFSEQGFIHLVNGEGYVLLHTQHEGCVQTTDNYFRDLYAAGNQEASAQLQRDIDANHSDFFASTMGGRRLYSAYTPVNQIHDWYLIVSVPVSAVSPNGNTVVLLFYVILLTVVLLFTLLLLSFIRVRNRQKTELERVAFVDKVTGGHTYNWFLREALRLLNAHPEQPYLILKLDIDNFKYINSFYGFDSGDLALRGISERLTELLMEDEALARISGDHFVMLLRDSSFERLYALIAAAQAHEQVRLYISAGLYRVDGREESLELMVDKAGTAARTIKGALRTRIAIYSDDFAEEEAHGEMLKRAIEAALENSEFEPYFQPKVDIDTRQLVGAEALARWITPEGKMIPPSEFVPLCEKTGLIVEIDRMILDKTLRLLAREFAAGSPCVPISANFSRLHLSNPRFARELAYRVKSYGIPTHLLEIELTESAFFENYDVMYDFITELHASGFAISMDDFGSGYSSLNMLKDIPIDVLKIDRGFLLQGRADDRRDIVFASIVEMAHRLGTSIVVEGVEFPENVALMRQCDCRIAQGYYFSRPLSEDAFIPIYKKGAL